MLFPRSLLFESGLSDCLVIRIQWKCYYNALQAQPDAPSLGTQPPWYEEAQAAPWRGPHGEKLTSSHVSASSWKETPQPQATS